MRECALKLVEECPTGGFRQFFRISPTESPASRETVDCCARCVATLVRRELASRAAPKTSSPAKARSKKK